MKKIFCLIFTILIYNIIFADDPQLPPEINTEYSKNGKYFVTADFHKKQISCYKINEEKSLWKIDSYYYYVFLTNDANYCVTSNYLDLIPLKLKKNDILFSVYKNGMIYDNVNLEKVVTNSNKLVKTVSHRHWGTINSVNSQGILLNTVEGKKIYYFETKEIESVKSISEFNIAKDDLNILTDKKCNEYLDILFDYIFTYDDRECISIIKKWKGYGVKISSEVINNKEVLFFDFLYGYDKNWLSSHNELLVLDGGNNFWRIYYDLKEKKFFNLGINGYA